MQWNGFNLIGKKGTNFQSKLELLKHKILTRESMTGVNAEFVFYLLLMWKDNNFQNLITLH